jgi:hypothetical protein
MATAGLRALMAIGLASTLGGALVTPVAAQKHVALVLDNSSIQAAAPAPSSERALHSSRIAEGLEKMRYRVIYGRQQDKAGMRHYIDEFRGALSDAEVALFYFKGVTLDASGRNLLVANNAVPGRPIDQSTIALDDIADLMTASRANVLLVDAGYADRTAEALVRSTSGLAPTMARLRDRNRFMVAFANMPGKIGRSDADSPFAEVIASYLSGKDITSADLGHKLRQDVFERTRGSQLPWVRSDLGTVQLAALPDASAPAANDASGPITFDRAPVIRAVQIELRRHRCYSGQINGDMEATDRALDTLGKTEPGKRSPYIVASRSNFEEFEAWLQWVRVIQNPICGREVAIPVAPAPKIKRPPPRPPKVVVAPRREQYRAPPRRRERDTEQSVSHTGVIGRGKGDYFAPTNPFYSPTR